jgi:hypothetical protein
MRSHIRGNILANLTDFLLISLPIRLHLAGEEKFRSIIIWSFADTILMPDVIIMLDCSHPVDIIGETPRGKFPLLIWCI